MNLPVQSAPVDRANRAIVARFSAGNGIKPSWGVDDIIPTYCALCRIFPNLPLCPTICPVT